MMRRMLPVMSAAVLVLACDGGPAAPAGSSSSPTAEPAAPRGISANALTTTRAGLGQGRDDVLVNMADNCDPDTFNAVLGEGSCVRSGGMKFDRFIDLLTELGFVGPWHFAPPKSNVQVGQEFVAVNRGGEVHTFTEVAEFGGGIVPILNTLSRVPEVAPECQALEPDDFVPAGGTYREGIDRAGALKYQCCIHPWMRLEARASEDR